VLVVVLVLLSLWVLELVRFEKSAVDYTAGEKIILRPMLALA
jgi:hypothetical protein